MNSENLQKMNNEQMKVADFPAQIDGKPNVARSAKLVISVFEAAGYEYVEEHPKNRFIFFSKHDNYNVQFWMDGKNKLKSALEFICERSFDLGYLSAKSELKKALGV